eukprot:TRINITY_DN26274_c0_g1_i3.p1 TRINITY_DN26274_c0_g1~~TRINITY_DN26274_c0_g1_i3.p1  ORF type:complete len:146 (-),score=51.17 TRINITY_DN26274_c0_g1_i3:145-582(-)
MHLLTYFVVFFFFFKQKTAYEMLRSLVGSEMCIRDRATNVMLREALETKELEWGTAGDNNLANFAPKESLLGEIEAHFNRFTSFGSPQKSSKMPNFMDVVKRDFENLAHRIHRLRQKMEKKWPDPPPAAGLDSPAPKDTPTVDTA